MFDAAWPYGGGDTDAGSIRPMAKLSAERIRLCTLSRAMLNTGAVRGFVSAFSAAHVRSLQAVCAYEHKGAYG